MRKLLGAILWFLLAVPTWAAWNYKFLTAAGGANDGRDTVGFNLAAATYTHVGTTITKAGAFAAYTWVAGDYICISSALEGKTNSLYLVAGKDSADVITLGAYVAGGGAFAADRADVTSSTGPWGLDNALAGAAAGDLVNWKAGTYTLGAAKAFITAGTTTAPVLWLGYKTYVGDQNATISRVAGTDIPDINCATYQWTCTGANETFGNLHFRGTTTTANGLFYATAATGFRALRCRFVNTQANANSKAFANATGTSFYLQGCYFSTTTTATACMGAASSVSIIGCAVRQGVIGISATGAADVIGSVVYGAATTGINIGSATTATNIINTSVNGTGTQCILVSAVPTTGRALIANVLCSNCGTYGIYNNTGANTNLVSIVSPAFWNAGTNLSGFSEQTLVTDLLPAFYGAKQELAIPFVNAGGSDYALVSGAVSKGSGWPGQFENQTYVNYIDVGGVQRQEAGGNNFVAMVPDFPASPRLDVGLDFGFAAGVMFVLGLSGLLITIITKRLTNA